MEMIQIAIASLLGLVGLTLLLRATLRFRRDHWQDWLAELRTATPDISSGSPGASDDHDPANSFATPAAQVADRVEHYAERPREEALFSKGTFAQRAAYDHLTFKLKRGHLTDLDHWGGVVAGLIYLRVEPMARLNVGVPLASEHTAGSRFDNLRKLKELAWVRIFLDESICHGILTAYNLGRRELADTLRDKVLEHLERLFSETALAWYRDHIRLDLFDRDWRRATTYHVDFFPLPENLDQPMVCEAYLQLASDMGQVAMPGLKDGGRLRFADRDFRTDQGYLPLDGNVLRIFQVGPQPSCHVQTYAARMGSTLTLGWRLSDEMGVAGILEVHALDRGAEGKTRYVLRYQAGREVFEAACKPGTQARLRNLPVGNETTYELWRCEGEQENQIASLVLLNPKPRLDDLPDCAVFEDLFERVNSVEDLARFLATQIYCATVAGRNVKIATYLEDKAGQAFFMDHGGLSLTSVQRHPLRCRLRLCVSSGTFDRLREWLGDRAMAVTLAERVREIFRQEDSYSEAIPTAVQRGFQAGEGTPGLTIQLSHDEALLAEAAMVRCLPVFVPYRRREIFGRIQFEDWPEAVDLSGISCRTGRTFFTDYPKGIVALHFSRFPVYELQVPQVFGAIRVHLLEPGTDKAELKIENRSNSAVIIDGKRVNRPNSHGLPLPLGQDLTVRLEYQRAHAEIIIYGHPKPQLDEPDFVPEAARLEMVGLGICRRLDRQGVDGKPFRELWAKAQLNEGIELLGATRATPQGYFVAVERDAHPEIHYLAGTETRLEQGIERTLAATDNTLDRQGLPPQLVVREPESPNVEIQYQRYDFTGLDVRNAGVLLANYWQRWVDDLQPLLPEGERLTRVELASCGSQGLDDPANFLYLVESLQSDSNQRRYWIFQPLDLIQKVRLQGQGHPLDCQVRERLWGPLEDVRGKLFAVDWQLERPTLVSFDVEDHSVQVHRYLHDGWFFLPEDAPYCPGGNLAAGSAIHHTPPAMFVANETLHFRESDRRRSYRSGLTFDPREYANFFDKDAYRVFYDSDRQAFAVAAQLHRKEAITPKSIFLVVPDSGPPILGSHALHSVLLPTGANWLVLPGIVFKFSQGPVYYG